MHVNWRFTIIYGYIFLIKYSQKFVVLEIISFHIYKNLVPEWKHGICPNDIIILNEKLENVSTTIIELTNIYKS